MAITPLVHMQRIGGIRFPSLNPARIVPEPVLPETLGGAAVSAPVNPEQGIGIAFVETFFPTEFKPSLATEQVATSALAAPKKTNLLDAGIIRRLFSRRETSSRNSMYEPRDGDADSREDPPRSTY